MHNELYEEYKEISKLSKKELFQKYKTSENGKKEYEVKKVQEANGLNIYIKEKKHGAIYFFLISLKDPFILILFFLAIINYMMADHLGSIIIVLIGLISALIRFFQDYSEYKFNKKLKSKIYSTANVIRNSKEVNIKTEQVVIGDIVTLNAGSIIPADMILIETKDLFINESVFTGESVPVEKYVTYNDGKSIFDIDNICLMESSVISGYGKGIVIKTGTETYIGTMGKELSKKHQDTNFDIGMKNITKLLLYYMIGTVFFILIVDGIIKGNYKSAILFALSVAVGITPSMLPMIVNVNIAKGSKTLAQKKTLVKRMEAIQNLGSMDVLCTDKTGTLTENQIVLQKYINVMGEEDITILKYVYLNSYFSTGMKNIIDKAVITYAKENNVESLKKGFKKIDEIPFDYARKLQSVVVKKDQDYIMFTKGALEEILKICTKINYKGIEKKITDDLKQKVIKKAEELENDGMQVIALAEKKTYSGENIFNQEDEKDMIFLGFVGFLAPAKKDVKEILTKLKNHGVEIKILTGDNINATTAICRAVGLEIKNILLGFDIDQYSDEELAFIVEKTNVFARLNPLQKERVVKILRKNLHVVGYMGDGVNDAPSLHIADVGISVDEATDIAKEASDIILLKKSLGVIYDGIIEGRKVYGNIIKYMKMALSGDFGDVFSIMIASIFLPFLPLLPIQMLFQDFIYDFSQIGIPYDNVDEEFLKKPKKWNTKGISRFMIVMGITSSLIDTLAFIIFWFVLGYNSLDQQAYFQTAWFVLCLLTELLIIHNVRTSKRPFIDSKASSILSILTLVSALLTIITPIIFTSISAFGFAILPIKFYIWAIILIAIYILLVTIVKKIYIKRYKEWL